MIEQTIRIHCDSCDQNCTLSYDSVAQAHYMARANGWERHATDGGTLDICPTCAQYMKEVNS
jgi:hypothetical protein